MAEKRKKTAKTAKTAVNSNSGRAAGSRVKSKTNGAKSAAAKAPTRAPAKKTVARKAAKPAAKKPAAAPAAVVTRQSGANEVLKVIQHSLDELKAANVRVLNVRELTDVADMLVIASGNSDRHVRSIADRVVQDAKKAGFRPLGVEGERDGEWVLVDLHDIIVHIMLPRIREFYRLENLWDVSAARREAAELAAAAEG
jgi:ribosome-associated protein